MKISQKLESFYEFCYRQSDKLLLVYSVLVFLIISLILLLPQGTFINLMAHDTFIFFDGAYRLTKGQIPHIDFITPLGMLCYFLPYASLKLTHSYALTMHVTSVLVGLFILVSAYICFRKRLSNLVSFLLITYLLLIVTVPKAAGDSWLYMTFAMFYNRFGWAALTILFLFYIIPIKKTRYSLIVDIMAISFLLVFLFYIKITYFFYGFIFLTSLLLGSVPLQLI